MRELILSMLSALVLPTALALAQTEPSAFALQVRPDTKLDSWSPSQTALSYLVDIGVQNKLPLGIVIEGVRWSRLFGQFSAISKWKSLFSVWPPVVLAGG